MILSQQVTSDGFIDVTARVGVSAGPGKVAFPPKISAPVGTDVTVGIASKGVTSDNYRNVSVGAVVKHKGVLTVIRVKDAAAIARITKDGAFVLNNGVISYVDSFIEVNPLAERDKAVIDAFNAGTLRLKSGEIATSRAQIIDMLSNTFVSTSKEIITEALRKYGYAASAINNLPAVCRSLPTGHPLAQLVAQHSVALRNEGVAMDGVKAKPRVKRK